MERSELEVLIFNIDLTEEKECKEYLDDKG